MRPCSQGKRPYFLHTGMAILVLALMTARVVNGQDKIRVLVDLSHEFTFRYDIFGLSPYWSGNFAIDKTSSFASLNATTLTGNDVLVISQSFTNVPFSSGESQMIKDWVAGGGGLWIAGNRRGYFGTAEVSPYPLQLLAEELGVTFPSTPRTGALRVVDHEVTRGVTGLTLDEGPTDNLLGIVQGSWNPLITDENNRPVIVAGNWGQGRVIVSAQDAIVSNPYQVPNVSNVSLVRNMVAWLGANKRGNRTQPVLFRILPENKVTEGKVDVYFPSTVANVSGLQFMKQQIAPLIEALEQQVHGVGLEQSMRFVALVGKGGGYSGGAEIGIAVHSQREALLLIMAHELTHSFDATGGTHPEWMHGWPSFAAIRTARLPQFGDTFQQAGDSEYRSRVDAFQAYEAARGPNSLDITEVDRGVSTNSWAIAGKLMVIIETLERSYGADFMARFYRLKRRYGSGAHSTERMIHWLSLAAGTDLYGFFRDKGTTVGAPIATLPVVYRTSPVSADPRTGLPPSSAPNIQATEPITVEFNASMDTASLISANITVSSSTRGTVATSVRVLDSKNIEIRPVQPLIAGELLSIRLHPQVKDATGKPLDGNGNGRPEGATTDDYAWSARVVPAASFSFWMLPSSARVSGLGGAFYTTDLTIANAGNAEGILTLKFLNNNVDGRIGPEKAVMLAAGKAVTYEDVLASVFNLQSAYGAVLVKSSVPTLAISAQTSTPAGSGGSFGQSVPAVSMNRWIVPGKTESIVAIREDAKFRTNLILANATESNLEVDLALFASTGQSLALRRVSLRSLEMIQLTRFVWELGGDFRCH
jgi:uncharacterized membrane protein